MFFTAITAKKSNRNEICNLGTGEFFFPEFCSGWNKVKSTAQIGTGINSVIFDQKITARKVWGINWAILSETIVISPIVKLICVLQNMHVAHQTPEDNEKCENGKRHSRKSMVYQKEDFRNPDKRGRYLFCLAWGWVLASSNSASQETTVRPGSRGFKTWSEFGISSLFRGTKARKTLCLMCFGAIREGRMIRDWSLPISWTFCRFPREDCTSETRILLTLGDKIQGPSWGQEKRRKPPFLAPSGPTFKANPRWLKVAKGGLKWPKGGLKWP